MGARIGANSARRAGWCTVRTMGASAPQPYPYERWPRVSREELRLLRGVMRALPPEGASRARAEAEILLGCALTVTQGAAQWLSAERAAVVLAASPTALWLEGPAGTADATVLCALPPELAAQLVDRVLGGDGRTAHPPGAPLDTLSSGVLAYLAARVLAALSAELRVVTTIQAPDRAAALLGNAPVIALPCAIALAGSAMGHVQLLAPAASAAALARTTASRPPVPQALRSLPIALCAHAAEVTLTRSALQALAPGDVVVPERCRFARGEAGFAGEAVLHVIGGRRARFRCAARDAQLTIETLEQEYDARSAMSDATRISTKAIEIAPEADLTQLAGDAPIELCLELARFTLPLDELSALRPGEVLATGKPIGARVALSAGGRTVARGELCEVDGEIGVRIVDIG